MDRILYVGAFAATLAAAAAECSTSQLLEPLGHGLWEAASTCHHEQGSGVNGGAGGAGGVDLSGWLAGVITNAVTVWLYFAQVELGSPAGSKRSLVLNSSED